MSEKKVILGIYEDQLHRMVPCALFKPVGNEKRDQVNRLVHDLFLMVGEPCDDKQKCSCYPYTGCVFGGTGFCFYYRPEKLTDTEWKPWQVPAWAISYAIRLTVIINKAEMIGHEHGYDSGLAVGKAFVKQLARGEIQVGQFENGDGRDDRRLTSKSW